LCKQASLGRAALELRATYATTHFFKNRPLVTLYALGFSFLSKPSFSTIDLICCRSNNCGRPNQCCQMIYYHAKNTNLGLYWRALEWKVLVYLWPFEYLTAMCYMLWLFGTFCGHVFCFFSNFGTTHREKSGNPGSSLLLLANDESETCLFFRR
jgi:hypothetical protein